MHGATRLVGAAHALPVVDSFLHSWDGGQTMKPIATSVLLFGLMACPTHRQAFLSKIHGHLSH
jgi:hypothetical protein